MNYTLCPNCESDDIELTIEGDYLCQRCGHKFQRNSSEILTELRVHTALLRRISTLLKKMLHRRGLEEEAKEILLETLEKRKGLTTVQVSSLLNISKATALSLMRELAEEHPDIRYVAGTGNLPSRIVRIRKKDNKWNSVRK